MLKRLCFNLRIPVKPPSVAMHLAVYHNPTVSVNPRLHLYSDKYIYTIRNLSYLFEKRQILRFDYIVLPTVGYLLSILRAYKYYHVCRYFINYM